MPEKTFDVVAVYTVTPGSEDEVLAELRLLAEASRTEAGNLRYEYFRGVEDPRKVVILESYRTAADFDAHRESVHFQQIGRGRIIQLLQDRTVSMYGS
ncbi:putative quinol monooxygenase [Arthrobacter sp. zg-Y1171]|uniref:putative quinol monooxygenase n=1 Tax=unclassified Arthrobacter TaxID=235627 RepID=UPI0021077398|nr:antibiotic biosynthesis monooxygenase family protein [Arthrobacter sp. zg-Y1171]MCQ1947592.1 antibiotic biosynthesis monooxygenase [Arthrobacter sp. zg-Y1116]MCQ1996873.1 antibiotic biosynthesis monooxygenase [Arthrobacter sp. zg-Y1171]UWX82461.1 antibiotic biosynthesis monooxygenase [Arthrobacter sp. zg-Y1171]